MHHSEGRSRGPCRDRDDHREASTRTMLWRATSATSAFVLIVAACSPWTGEEGSAEAPNSESLYVGPTLTEPLFDVPCQRPTATGAAAELPALRLDCLGPGPSVSLPGLSGRPTLINLWATWCGPCRREMPMLASVHADVGGTVRFIGVDTKDDPEAAVEFLDDTGVRYEQLYDPDGELLTQLKVAPGLPITLLLDRSGHVVWRNIGEVEEVEVRDHLAEVA